VQRVASGLQATLRDGSSVEVDTVLGATGRRPNVSDLGLDDAGVRVGESGEIVVDDRFRSSVPHICAIGDVINRVQLTPVALAEATTLVGRLFGDGDGRMDYAGIPTAVFTRPSVGTVGLTEAQARRQYDRVRIYRNDFKALKHTLSGSGERTLMKLVVDGSSGRVLGAHMVGDVAGEIVQGFAVALKAGATKAVFDATIGIHPTVAEEFVTIREPVP
jgi:glutathione reductase (NADPH)